MKRILVLVLSSLVAVSAAAVEIKTFADGPVKVTGTYDKYNTDEGMFSTLGYVSERLRAGDLPADLTYEIDVIPRSPAIPKEDGSGTEIPANAMTAYCMHSGSLERADSASWVPFLRTAVGAPVKVASNFDLQFTARRDGVVVFQHTYEVRVERESRSSRFNQPCADQFKVYGKLYQETFTAAFQKALVEMKAIPPQAALQQ